jgi:hypothetical protein
MNTSTCIVILLVAVLVTSAPAQAQDSSGFHFGAGISVEPSLFGQTLVYDGEGMYLGMNPLYSASPYYIYLPVTLTKNFRVEPRFGIYSYSNESTNSLSPSETDKSDFTITHIGLAVEYIIPVSERFQMYAGPRAGLNFLTSTSTSYQYNGTPSPVSVTTTNSETDFMISGIFGGEYLPVKDLSIGGEIDINYVTFGNPDYTESSAPVGSTSTTTITRSLVSTGALLFIRWNFF